MASWPSSLPPPDWGLEEEYYKPQLKMEFEANYGQSRPKATRGQDRWGNLGWGILEEAHYQTLKAFFSVNQGSVFLWTHPITGVSHNCRFSADSIKSSFGFPGWRKNVQCPIEEI
ncbi:MAG TPA: hypothetical protein VLL97_08900 [Acidobacteriota bacterium]|nr:hypothetical protein [Acidobacteriota bacterium]